MSEERRALSSAYDRCRQLAHSHYENFPVASWLLPGHLRAPVSAIYAFARLADDLADEGVRSATERLDALHAFGQSLDLAIDGREVEEPVLMATADTVRRHQLPPSLLHDLLTAFRMDVSKRRYESHEEVLLYCRYSANPVGRLLLHMVEAADPRLLTQSDAVCTALQLINFLQDLRQDYEENGRIYLPLEDMRRFGVTESHIRDGVSDDGMRGLIRLETGRAGALLRSGSGLGKALGGRMGIEVSAIVAGGGRVLRALERQTDDVFTRPRLRARDRMAMAWEVLWQG